MKSAIYGIIAAIVVIGVIVWGALTNWWNYSNNTSKNPTPATQETQSQTPQSGQVAISISDFAFDPATITITSDSKVTWTNNDFVSHDIVADDNTFSSNQLDRGKSFSFSFNQTGTFTYHCGIHPSMTAKIIVQ